MESNEIIDIHVETSEEEKFMLEVPKRIIYKDLKKIIKEKKITRDFKFNIFYNEKEYTNKDINYEFNFEEGDIIYINITVILEKCTINADFHKNLNLNENDKTYDELSGILLLLLLKYVARNIDNFKILDKIENEKSIDNISEIKKVLLDLKDGIQLTNDPKENIKAQLSETKGNNILSYSNYISSINIKKEHIEKLINKLFNENKKNQIKEFWSILSKYQTFNEDFERDFKKAIEKSYFDFSLIGLSLYQQKGRKNFVENGRKCPRAVVKFLFHGTQIDPITKIVTEEFKYAKRPLFGMGIYFTDKLDYASYYAGGTNLYDRRDNFGKVISVGQTISCIATEVYYDFDKKTNIYDNKLVIKGVELDDFPTYEQIKKDFPNYMVEENGVHYIRVKASDGRVQNEKEIEKNKKEGKFMGVEYVITEMKQILPLYGLTLKRNEYFVVWRDPGFSFKNRHSEYLHERKQFIYKKAKMNGFFDNSIENLLKIIKRKKYNKIILLSNCGVDGSGKRFVEIVRKILGFDVMVLFFSCNKEHLNWIKDFPNALYTDNPTFYENYINNYNKEGLISLKKEIEKEYKKYNLKLNFTEDFLSFPKFVENTEHDKDGNLIYKEYDNLIFGDICPYFRKVVIKNRGNSKLLFMRNNGEIELKPSSKIKKEKQYIWYITLLDNEITLFSNNKYLYFDLKSNTAKYNGMEKYNYEKIENEYLIFYKNKDNVMTINEDKIIFTKEQMNKKNQLFSFVDDIDEYY